MPVNIINRFKVVNIHHQENIWIPVSEPLCHHDLTSPAVIKSGERVGYGLHEQMILNADIFRNIHNQIDDRLLFSLNVNDAPPVVHPKEIPVFFQHPVLDFKLFSFPALPFHSSHHFFQVLFPDAVQYIAPRFFHKLFVCISKQLQKLVTHQIDRIPLFHIGSDQPIRHHIADHVPDLPFRNLIQLSHRLR